MYVTVMEPQAVSHLGEWVIASPAPTPHAALQWNLNLCWRGAPKRFSSLTGQLPTLAYADATQRGLDLRIKPRRPFVAPLVQLSPHLRIFYLSADEDSTVLEPTLEGRYVFRGRKCQVMRRNRSRNIKPDLISFPPKVIITCWKIFNIWIFFIFLPVLSLH